VERDSAFSRLIGSRSKPQNRIEEIALELAGKTGIRRMSEFSGRQAWNSIWKQATEMSQEAQ
ncbi:TPA: replication protein 15, partial [Proteus mirabilis]